MAYEDRPPNCSAKVWLYVKELSSLWPATIRYEDSGRTYWPFAMKIAASSFVWILGAGKSAKIVPAR
jgi:hypothetical protein